MNCGGVPSLPRCADVAGGAVALVRVLEQLEPARLAGRQRRLAGEIGVVLAAVGIEGRASPARRPRAPSRIAVEGRVRRRRGTASPKIAAQVARRSRPRARAATTSCGLALAISNGESSGMRAWSCAAVGAAVPGQAAGRAVVDALVGLVLGLEEVLGERRHRLEVAERRHRAQAGLAQVAAAELHRERVGRPEGVRPGCGRRRRRPGRRRRATGRGTASRPSAAERARTCARTSARLQPGRRRLAGRRRARPRPIASAGGDGRALPASGSCLAERWTIATARRRLRCRDAATRRQRPAGARGREQEAFDDETASALRDGSGGHRRAGLAGRSLGRGDAAADAAGHRPDPERGRDLRGEPQLRQSLRPFPGANGLPDASDEQPRPARPRRHAR